jgi:hypothetical protein
MSIGHIGQLFFDEADITASFDAANPNVGKVIGMCVKTHVLVEIMH